MMQGRFDRRVDENIQGTIASNFLRITDVEWKRVLLQTERSHCILI